MEVFPSSVMNTPAAETELNLQDIAREAANERFKTLSPSVKDESPLVQVKSANTNSTTTTTSTNSKINLLIDTLNLSIKSSMNNSLSCGNSDDGGTGTLGSELKKTEENSHISGSTLSAAETLLKIKQYQPIGPPPPSSHCLNDNSLASYNDENSINNNNNNNNNRCGYNSDKNDDLDFNENEDDDDNNNDNSNDVELAQIKNKSPLSPPSLSASQSPIAQNDASIDDDDEERQILNELQNDEISENGMYIFILDIKIKIHTGYYEEIVYYHYRIGKKIY